MTRLLVVDDEEQIVRALRNLRARQHSVDTAPDGATALHAASRRHPDPSGIAPGPTAHA